MKKMLKFMLLIVLISPVFSFKEKTETPEETKIAQLVKTYGLKLTRGNSPKNVKQFATLADFETYLKYKSKKVTGKAKAKLQKVKKRDGLGSSGAATNSYYESRFIYVELDFNQFLIDGYPNIVSLTWDTDINSIAVNSWLSGQNWVGIYPHWPNYFYTQISGSRGGSTITVTGEYEESIFYNGLIYTRVSDFSLDATWGYGTINAYATIEP